MSSRFDDEEYISPTERQLLDLTANQLLEEFGAGNPTPGSGSAAIFNGLLSAKLALTVIDLTIRKPGYEKWLPELLNTRDKIERKIYPQLKKYFQMDSDLFEKPIELLKQYHKEKSTLKKEVLYSEYIKHLNICTEIPVRVANLCNELAEHSLFIFENGWKAVRGDSSVAANNAIAAVGGCISIINLNLTYFENNSWAVGIISQLEIIKKVNEINKKRLSAADIILESERIARMAFNSAVTSIRTLTVDEYNLQDDDIEAIANKVHDILLDHKEQIWKRNVPENDLLAFSPEKVLTKVLGYKYEYPESIGMYFSNGEIFDVAGMIDKNKKIVTISQSFPMHTQNFTAAHELGHALLHKQIGQALHRDKPIDGSSPLRKNRQEWQADRFAAYFLMPRAHVIAIFQRLFLMDRFIVDDNTATFLGFRSASELKKKYRTSYDVAKMIASTEIFGGKPFNSMAKLFNVSVATMAIQLEKFGLIKYD
jgi:formiminotetrahydrofolate cyclodeaminase/Zn-dependent peptidase ImmA (M78 family)